MSWDPKKARNLLDKSSLTTYLNEMDKLVSYKMLSGRELALIEENKFKVSIYVEIAPSELDDVILTKTYEPTKNKRGRHSNLELITSKLGFNNEAHLLHVQSETGLINLLDWYQRA
ncbi:hypothetical protein [Photobacterium sp. J15]|uniref:hypothetical protein n=1 Tax=Photobacterium sp. J15 TaxID=265901 RepID=UPI0007E3E7E5|nr:hypothetical protein [Photobacterium sp. J15]